MIPSLTSTGMSAIQTIQQRAIKSADEHRTDFIRAGWRYYYEPTCRHLPETFSNGRPYWRGPHRFAHAMHVTHPNHSRPVETPMNVLGWLTRDHSERLYWCLDQFGPEGYGKHDRWGRVCAFQFTFQREDDAFAFKMRWL